MFLSAFYLGARFATVSIVLVLGGCAFLEKEQYPVPADYPIHGIDVSRYQGVIDWKTVKEEGHRFAWIKATEGGDHADEKFALNWIAAHDAGIARGAYHFYFWCRPVQDQINWFIKNVPVESASLPPVLDVEWNGDYELCPKKVPKAQALAAMKAFLVAIERHYGKRPVIYTTIDFYRDVIVGDLHDYSLWVRTVNAHPQQRYPGRRWAFWQYTAEGRVAGIKGNVDRNTFFGSEEQWQAFLKGPQWTPVASQPIMQPFNAASLSNLKL